MAKKSGMSVSDIIYAGIALIIGFFCTIGYFMLVFLPTILFGIGLLRSYFKVNSKPKIKSVHDLDLTASEKERLEDLDQALMELKLELKRIKSEGKNVAKRADGQYNERSKLGKDLNSGLAKTEPKYRMVFKKHEEIENLPETRKRDWLTSKSSFNAYLAASPIFLFLFLVFFEKSYGFVHATYHYITVVPKSFATIVLNIVMEIFPSLKTTWLANIFEYGAEYHSPLFVASLAAFLSYFIFKGIIYSITEKKIENAAEKNKANDGNESGKAAQGLVLKKIFSETEAKSSKIEAKGTEIKIMNQPLLHKTPRQRKMADLIVDGRMKVKTLKETFNKDFGIGVRVYKGKKFADDGDTLASIRSGDAKGGVFSMTENMKVRNAETKFKDKFGISIQIEDKAGKLADNNITITAARK